MLQEVYPKKAIRSIHRQNFVDFLTDFLKVSVRRACEVFMANPPTFYYCSRKNDPIFLCKWAAKNKAIRDKIGEIRIMLK